MSRAGTRTVALPALAAALIVAALAAPAARAQQGDSDRPVTVQLIELSPVLLPDESLHLRATLVNSTDEPVRNLAVRLRVGQPISNRSELKQVASDPPGTGAVTTIDLPDDDDLRPRSTVPVAADVPAGALAGLADRSSVQPLRIEVRGTTEDGARRVVGALDTFVQWWPERTAATRIAWLWPLLEHDRLRADGVFADETLGESIAPGGRLAELVDVAGRTLATAPVTWVVDPALVTSVQRMTSGYRVVRDRDDTKRGEHAEDAQTFLSILTRVLADTRTSVLALPYADPDINALVSAGRTADVTAAVERGREVLVKQLKARVDPTLAWPPSGYLTEPSFDLLSRSSGVRGIVVAADALKPASERNYTPTATRPLDETTPRIVGVVADDALSTLVDGGSGASGSRLAVQRFLAETALITLERPGLSRDVVVTPPRRWTPLQRHARELLSFTAEVPWLMPVTLPEVASNVPDDAGPAFLTYPSAVRDGELPQAYLTRIEQVRERLSRLRALLPALSTDDDFGAVVTGLEDAVTRASSARWRDALSDGRDLLEDTGDRVDAHLASVHVSPGRGVVTLTSDTGRIPITIVNDLQSAVRLRVAFDTAGRLDIEGPDIVEVTVPARGSLQHTVEGRAVRAGEFTIGVRLLTPDGRALPSGAAQVRVRSTAYGRVALVVVIGGGAVLLAGSAVRLARRRRRAAAAESVA